MEAGAIAALAQVPRSWGTGADGTAGPGAGTVPDAPVLAAVQRLGEIPGVSQWLAVVIIAEIGLDMTVFPAPARWSPGSGVPVRGPVRHPAREGQAEERQQLRPRRRRAGRPRRLPHRHLLRGTVPADRPPPRQGHRPDRGRPLDHDHRLAPAVQTPPPAYRDLGEDHYAARASRDKKIRGHLRELQALGLTITITSDDQAA